MTPTIAVGSHAVAQTRAPGTVHPQRFLPKFHWELITCGLAGHELIGTDAAEFRDEDRVVCRDMDGARWHRCLRCDSWLSLPPPEDAARPHPPDRDEIELPLRGRPLRDKIVLRLIAIDRALHFVILGLLGIAVFLFTSHRTSLRDTFYRVVADLQGGVGGGPVQTSRIGHHGLLHDLDRLFSLKGTTLHLLGAGILAYAVLEGVEAVGLWLQKRWAEYLTFLATTLFLPLEVYELTKTVSPFKVIALIINLAVVIYLLYAKRLFGLRGGAAADEALREEDVGWEALERATP
jgi:uncharacterized membrane protein (DUF2068 family)